MVGAASQIYCRKSRFWRFHFFAIINLRLQNDGGFWQEINFDNVPHVLSANRMSVTVRDDVLASDSESVLFSLRREYFWMCESRYGCTRIDRDTLRKQKEFRLQLTVYGFKWLVSLPRVKKFNLKKKI